MLIDYGYILLPPPYFFFFVCVKSLFAFLRNEKRRVDRQVFKMFVVCYTNYILISMLGFCVITLVINFITITL